MLKQDASKALESLKKKVEEIEADELAFHAKQKTQVNRKIIQTDKLMKRLYSQKEEFLLLSLFVTFREAGEEELEKFVDYCTT